MANFVRSAKSGSSWTMNELTAYNIAVVYQDAPTFFQMPILPPPTVKFAEVLTTEDPNSATNDDVYALLSYIKFATSPETENSAINDFASHLLRMLGYTGRDRLFRTRKDIPLVICGERRHAKTHMCVVNEQGFLLLVKRHMGHVNPEAQLIAEAIAAFAANNKILQDLGQAPLQSKTMAGIILKGTMPTFYKILVTMQLIDAVASGAYPETCTTVHAHAPSIPRPNEGMKPLDNRNIILSCYEAFRQFVN